MKRKKWFTIRRLTLALAVAAIVPASASAAPTYSVGPGEIPYLSQGVGVDERDFAGAQASTSRTRVEIPYLSQGVGVTSAELSVGSGADDRSFSKATPVEATPVVSDGGSSTDFGTYAVTSLLLVLVLGTGMGIAIRHSRKTKLSPA